MIVITDQWIFWCRISASPQDHKDNNKSNSQNNRDEGEHAHARCQSPDPTRTMRISIVRGLSRGRTFPSYEDKTVACDPRYREICRTVQLLASSSSRSGGCFRLWRC